MNSTTLTPIETEILKGEVIANLRTVYDPEIPVNIFELGLIYNVEVNAQGVADIRMTLTSPGCPVAGTMPLDVETKARDVDGITDAHVDLVWEPTWNMDMMSDEAKLELGLL